MARTRLSALAALALAGCSAIVDPDKIAPTGIGLDQLCAQIDPALVGKAVACTHSPEAWIRQGDFLPNCANWSKAVAAGRMVYDPDKGQQCLDALAAATCQETFGDVGGPPAVCLQALEGQVQDGGSCWDDFECRPASWCDSSACPGTCKRRASLLQPCSSGDSCEAGLACQYDPTVTAAVCKTVLAPNAICTVSDAVCGPGLYCDALASGRCVSQRTSGSCTRWEECLGPEYVCSGLVPAPMVPGVCALASRVNQGCTVGYNLCPGGTWCRTATGTQAFGEPGTCALYDSVPNACGDFGGGEFAWCYGGYCGAGTPRACVGWFPDGTSCAGYGGEVCRPGARCRMVSGTGPYCVVCTAP